MTASLTEACTDLAAWLPVVGELVSEPDIAGGSEGHAAPGSKPPWNPAAAAAKYDAHAAVRRIETHLRALVTGSVFTRSGSDLATLSAIGAIQRLAEAAGSVHADDAARELNHHLMRILQLPAIDLEDRPQRIAAPCPYCKRPMLRLFPRDGRLTCLAYGSCTDSDGKHPQGVMQIGAVSGEPYVAWADGMTQERNLQ